MVFSLEGIDEVGKTTVWKLLQLNLPSLVARRDFLTDSLIVWDDEATIPLRQAHPRVYEGRWLFLYEALPPKIRPKTQQERSWVYHYYRQVFTVPPKVRDLVAGIIMDRGYLSNVVYTTGDPEIQDLIYEVETARSMVIDKFIILVPGQEPEDPHLREINRRYLDWAARYPSMSEIVKVTGPAHDVARKVDSLITELA